MQENESLFIEHEGRRYPVHFAKSRQSWIWKQKNWMNVYNPDPEIIKYAENIQNRFYQLVQLSAHDFVKKEMADCYAKELEASWEIEGEHLDSCILRSKLIQKLGLNVPEWSPHRELVRSDKEDAALDGCLFLLNQKGLPSLEMLCSAHKKIGQAEENRGKKAYYGLFRSCGEVVGRLDIIKNEYLVTYEGPPCEQVQSLMQKYIEWWKISRNQYPLPIGAALAHLYFVIIHPFHDGNGRMARLLADKYYAVSDEAPFQPVHHGATIRTHRTDTSQTLLDNSAKTGASEATVKNITLPEDMNSLPNIQKETLLPYICISSEIIGRRYEYYNSLSRASSDRYLNDFVFTMLIFQNNAIEGALARIPKLKKMHDFFALAGERLSLTEKLILRNSYLSDEELSTKDKCFADIHNEYEAEIIWKNLHDVGLLNAFNKAVLDISLVDKK